MSQAPRREPKIITPEQFEKDHPKYQPRALSKSGKRREEYMRKVREKREQGLNR